MLKQRNLLLLFIIICAIRLAITQLMGLMPQDAYYYFYSEELALSYFDHPPMVAYMLRLFGVVLGKSVAAIKLTNFVVTLGTLAAFYYLAKFFLSQAQSVKTTLFFGSTLLVTILSLNTTPDVPLLFFWAISLVVLYQAVFAGKSWCWPLAGLLMGCSFESKYTALFLLFGLFLFLLLAKDYRRFLFSWELFFLLVFFVIGIAPVVIWNMQNDWMSFRFQSSERASSIMAFQLQPQFFLGNLGMQAALLLPPLFGGLCFAFYRLSRKVRRSKRMPTNEMLFLLCFSLPLLGFFGAVSLLYWVKLNWMMPAYITLLIALVRYFPTRLLTYQLMIALVAQILLFTQIVFYPIAMKTDDTWYGWEQLAQKVSVLQEQHPDYFVFSNDGYKTSAVLSFYLTTPVYAGNVIGKDAYQFGVRYPDLHFLTGQNAIYIDSDKAMSPTCENQYVSYDLRLYFERIVLADPIFITDDRGKSKRKFCVYLCYGYKGDLE